MKCETYSLGDVCTFIDYRGKTPPKTTSGIPLVTAKIVKNGMIQEPQEFIAENYYDEWMRRGIPKKGSVVFTTEAPLGEVARIRTDDKLAFAQRIIVLEPKTKQLSADYLFYALQDRVLKSRIEARSTGTTVIGIKAAELKKVEIDLPSLEEQEKIAAILCSLDDKIELNNKINENLLAQADLLYDQFFSDEKIFTELGNVIETTSGGTPSRKHPELYENPSICWVKSKELNGGFIHTTEEMINEIALSKSAAKMLPAHCVLVAMYGATVGEYGIIASPMTCNQAVCALISNNRYPYPYLYELIRHSKEKLKNMAVGSAQQNISQVLIKQLPVHTNLDKVEQFAEATIASFQMIETLTLENIHLAFMRDTLLPKLMSGEIDVGGVNVCK